MTKHAANHRYPVPGVQSSSPNDSSVDFDNARVNAVELRIEIELVVSVTDFGTLSYTFVPPRTSP